MSGPTEIVGTCRRAVITGGLCEQVWSELSGKLTFLRYAEMTWYAEATCEATSKRGFVVYAHTSAALRKKAWLSLFPGAETAEKLGKFEECERYRLLKDEGRLKTLGKPLRKDVIQQGTVTSSGGANVSSAKAVTKSKAVTLCKKVDEARAELLNFPAKRNHEEAVDALLRMRAVTTNSDAVLDAHKVSALPLLQEREQALLLEWLAEKPVYDAKRLAFFELSGQRFQAVKEELEECKRALEKWQELKREYLLDMPRKDKWDEEDAKKVQTALADYKVMKKRKQLLMEWDVEAKKKKRKRQEERKVEAENKKRKIQEDDEAEYAKIIAWAKEVPGDVEFECVSLTTKLGEKSVDCRLERPKLEDWLEMCGIVKLVMMVDNVNKKPNHQVMAQARWAMTISKWNNTFAPARMIVQDVRDVPVDLDEAIENMCKDGKTLATHSHTHCLFSLGGPCERD
jgi:hypothetical protein